MSALINRRIWLEPGLHKREQFNGALIDRNMSLIYWIASYKAKFMPKAYSNAHKASGLPECHVHLELTELQLIVNQYCGRSVIQSQHLFTCQPSITHHSYFCIMESELHTSSTSESMYDLWPQQRYILSDCMLNMWSVTWRSSFVLSVKGIFEFCHHLLNIWLSVISGK